MNMHNQPYIPQQAFNSGILSSSYSTDEVLVSLLKKEIETSPSIKNAKETYKTYHLVQDFFTSIYPQLGKTSAKEDSNYSSTFSVGEENTISLKNKDFLQWLLNNLITKLIIEQKIKVSDKNTLYNLITKLWESELELLHKLLSSIAHRLSKFYINIYKSESSLPKVYICPIFTEKTSIDQIAQELYNLNEEKVKIDPRNLLWFIGFSYETESF